MFINRPLIHGRSVAKEKNGRNSSSVVETKNKIRIKTLPSPVHHTINKANQHYDMALIEGNLIGIKDIKEMMEGDLEELKKRLLEFEEITEQEEKKLLKGFSKLVSKKSTISQPLTSEINGKEIKLEDEEEKAYRECVQLLMHERKQQEKVQEKFAQQLSRKFYQLQQTRIQLQELRKVSSNQLSLIQNSINRTDHQTKLVSKKISNKQRLIEEIKVQKQRILQMNEKLFESKQESIKQKNQFVEIQAEEINLIKEIQVEEGQENSHNQLWEQFQYLKKIQKLKGKLLKQKAKDSKEIDEFFKDKISSIVKLRVSSDETEQKIDLLSQNLQQQQAVILMLTNKTKQQHQESNKEGQTAEQLYKQKYNQIFNSSSPIKIVSNDHIQTSQTQSDSQFREIDHWQNYKFYLSKILKNEKRLKSLHESPSQNSSFLITQKERFEQDYERDQKSRRNSINLIQSQNIELTHNRQQKKKSSVPSIVGTKLNQPTQKKQTPNTKTQTSSTKKKIEPPHIIISPKPKPMQPLQQQRQKMHTPLPKLIKMQGSLSDKHKIKNELTKFTNDQLDESVELQTVRTSQCDGEDVIEVEFKGTKPKHKQVQALMKKDVCFDSKAKNTNQKMKDGKKEAGNK